MHTTPMTLMFKFMQILALFLFRFIMSPFLVVWWVVFWRIISSSFPFIFSISITLVLSYLLDKCFIHFRKRFRTCGMWLMIFHKKTHYFVQPQEDMKLHSLYCCCKIIFEAWKVKNVFSNIWSSVIFSSYNFSCGVILKRA